MVPDGKLMVLGGPQPWASSKVEVFESISYLPLAALLLVTFLAVIVYNYRSTSRIVLMLCDDLDEKNHPDRHSPDRGFSQGSGGPDRIKRPALASNRRPALCNEAKLERLAMECVRSQPQIAMFFIGDRQGNFLLAKPEVDGSITTKFINRQGKAAADHLEILGQSSSGDQDRNPYHGHL